MRKFISVISATVLALNMQAQNPFKIYDSRAKKETDLNTIVDAFRDADVLFFGEEHNDSIGHVLEKMILEQAHKTLGDKLVLSMEMFETDVQIVVDEYLAGYIKENNLIKEARAWNNYNDYKPLIEYAKDHKLKVIAANTPARYTGSVSRNGLQNLEKFSDDAKKFLPPLPIDTATGKYREKFMEVMGEHANMPGLHMYESQNLWDATMAYSIYKTWKKDKKSRIYHLNGKFHTDEKLGIPAQLKKYAGKKEVKMLNISCFPDDSFDNPDWTKFIGLGDFIIITMPQKEKSEKKP